MGTFSSRPQKCSFCGKEFCQGECKKCEIRLKGECTNLCLTLTHRKTGLIIFEWACVECFLTKKGVKK